MWCYREIVKIVDISVMFECFHFQHFEQVSQRYIFFCLFLKRLLFLQFTAATLNIHSEWTLLNSESYCFPPKEGCSSFYVLYYYLCVGQCNFSLWAAPSKSVLEGVKAVSFNMSQGRSFLTSQHPLTLILIKVLIELSFQLFFHVLIFKFDWLILM